MTLDISATSPYPQYPGGKALLRLEGTSLKDEADLVVPDGEWTLRGDAPIPDFISDLRRRVAPIH